MNGSAEYKGYHYVNGAATMQAEDQFFEYDFNDELPDSEDYIRDLNEGKLFSDAIKRRLEEIGCGALGDDMGKILSALQTCCKEAGVEISRQTLTNWLKSDAPSAADSGRENVYKLCFALKMTADETEEFFLKAYLERPFYYKNIRESVFFFCMKNGRSYADAKRLIQTIESMPIEPNPCAPDATREIGHAIRTLRSEEELLSFLAENRAGFAEKNKTAKREFDKLVKSAMALAEREYTKTGIKNRDGTEEKEKRVEKIDTLLSTIYGYSARQTYNGQKVIEDSISKSAFPKAIRRNFPQRQQFHNIENGRASYDVIRKALIVLNFYTFYAKAFLEKREGRDLFDDFVMNTDHLLFECGYVQLYWRNPFDWLIGHCAFSCDPLERFRALIAEYYLKDADTAEM